MVPVKNLVTAFAFDIDGVFVNGTKPVPESRETIELLQRLNIPFIFLTNGGGHTEQAHVAKLEKRLGLTNLSARQFVQSHTPYRDLVNEYGDKTILSLGGHGQQIRDLAHAYGFKKVVTSSDVLAEFKHIHPFPEMTRAHHEEHGRGDASLRTTQISAILCWTSPRDWCLDLQVVKDLLLSKDGVFGTRSPKNGDKSLDNQGYLQDGQPKLYFCNPDFEWSTEHPHPRFAQGAFCEALMGIWKHATNGAELEHTIYGKPTEATYRYAEKALREFYYGDAAKAENGQVAIERPEIGTVYMIGDNPESDIKGANSFESKHGIEWKSVLVETGVYVSGSIPAYEPDHIAKNVKEAVEWALRKEGVKLD